MPVSKRNRQSEEDEAILSAFLEAESGQEGQEYVPLKQRRTQQLDRLTSHLGRGSHGTRLDNGRSQDDPPIKNEHVREGSPAPPASLSGSKSLVAQAAEMRKADQYLDERTRKRLDQEQYEAALLKEANQVQTNALTSVVEIATGEARGDKMKTS